MITLSTERLVMRLPVKGDLDSYEQMWSNSEMLKHIPIKVQTRSECWDRLIDMAGRWVLCGYSNWLVFEELKNELVGQFGFFKATRGYGPDFDDHLEAGWMLTPAASGKGFATEGMQAALAWLDEQDFGDRTVCGISENNDASIRVAEKCGYEHLGSADDDLGPVKLMVRFKPNKIWPT